MADGSAAGHVREAQMDTRRATLTDDRTGRRFRRPLYRDNRSECSRYETGVHSRWHVAPALLSRRHSYCRTPSLAGLLTIPYPFWQTIDRAAADLQALFFNDLSAFGTIGKVTVG